MSLPERLVVVDVEGNGGTPPELVELGLLVLDGERVVDQRAWLVRPTNAINRFARNVHGISNEMVADAPSSAEIANEFGELVRGAWLVGHNVGVDASVLRREFRQVRVAGLIDTLALARRVWPSEPSHSLGKLVASLRLDPADVPGDDAAAAAHRALYDCRLTAALLLRARREQPDLAFELRDHADPWDRRLAVGKTAGLTLF